MGVGADTATKRMVKFLSESGVDISIISFHAYLEAGETLLARQVEARGSSSTIAAMNTKAGNQAQLDHLLDVLKIKAEFEELASAFRNGFGPPVYQWPYKNAYAFSKPGVGNYVTLYVDPDHPNQVKIYLQQRAIAAATFAKVQELGEEMGSTLTQTPSGYVYFWVSVKLAGQTGLMARPGQSIGLGAIPSNEKPQKMRWKKRMLSSSAIRQGCVTGLRCS